MTESIPASYRRLFATYPRAWRDDYEEVVAHTLLEVHAGLGRTAPSVGERLLFAAAGVVRRLHRGAPPTPSTVPSPAPLALFDQTNGIAPATDAVPGVEVSERNRRRIESSRVAMAIMWGDHI